MLCGIQVLNTQQRVLLITWLDRFNEDTEHYTLLIPQTNDFPKNLMDYSAHYIIHKTHHVNENQKGSIAKQVPCHCSVETKLQTWFIILNSWYFVKFSQWNKIFDSTFAKPNPSLLEV